MKFHESLPALMSVLLTHNVDINPSILVVRDAKGRLYLGSSGEALPDELPSAIKSSLGAYASDSPLVPKQVVELLLAEPAVRTVKYSSNGVLSSFSLLDRRVVGSDWLCQSKASVSKPKRLVFGSLKGGVGRSTALAVLAADLARAGKRVLAIDLDLEAPGIGYMFLPESPELADDRRPKYGVLDYLLENSLDGITDEELIDFIGISPFAEGSIDVIPAVGRETDERPSTMIAKLSRALTEDVGDNGQISVASQISSMIDRFESIATYDAVLIDARAGLSEITAAPLLCINADVMLFGIDQPQTFRGYSYLLSHVSNHLAGAPDRAGFESWRRRVHFVHAKARSAAAKRAHFREEIYDLCAEYLYDRDDGSLLAPEVFSPSPSEDGIDIPHDTIYIASNSEYEAFDPVGDATQLDPEVYRGPFGDFLERSWSILEIDRGSNEVG